MIVSLDACQLTMTDDAWPFAERNRVEIATHWNELSAGNPALWNGKVLRARNPRVENGVLLAEMVVTDFASVMAWRDWGYPDRTHYNCFGSAIIRSRDGDVLLGRMAAHTANAGAVYPPGGSLDLSDVRADGSVDAFGSVVRELKEETGLDAAEAKPEDSFAVSCGQEISVSRVLRFDRSTKELSEAIWRNLQLQKAPELSGTVVISSLEDIDTPGLNPYSVETVQYIFGQNRAAGEQAK